MSENTEKYGYSSTKKQSLSIEQWYEYAKAGVDLPVTTLLHGISMEPLIRYKKDPVTVVPLKRDLIPGDIVLFRRRDGVLVVHRFFRMSSEGTEVQTWGDNCFYPDPPIKKEDVLGLVICVEKDGKKIMLDTEEQRAKGVRWMNGSIKRKIWFTYRRARIFAARCKRFVGRRVKKVFN